VEGFTFIITTVGMGQTSGGILVEVKVKLKLPAPVKAASKVLPPVTPVPLQVPGEAYCIKSTGGLSAHIGVGVITVGCHNGLTCTITVAGNSQKPLGVKVRVC
jgi:hypothetical protein